MREPVDNLSQLHILPDHLVFRRARLMPLRVYSGGYIVAGPGTAAPPKERRDRAWPRCRRLVQVIGGIMSYRRLGPVVMIVLAGSAIVVAPSQLTRAASKLAEAPLLPNPSSTTNVLNGVSATSAGNAWAVGYYDSDSTGARDGLILHWDGRRWAQVKRTPSPSRLTNVLSAVFGTSASNAWAVGYYVNGTAEDSLILHWNGKTWKKVSSPDPSSTSNHLNGVWAASAKDAWAVGQYRNNRTGESDTLILHWNGQAWKHVTSPNPSPGPQDANTLNGVTGTSGRNAWAVGFYYTSLNNLKTLVLRWNGRQWTQVRPPSPGRTGNMLSGVAAASASRAWAVGAYTNNKTSVNNTLILGWNGTAWSREKSPNAGAGANMLTGVGSTSPGNAWAVGQRSTNAAGTFFDTLILRWDGTRWTQVKPTPNPSSTTNMLSGVSATSARNAWAVGCYHNDRSGATDTLILRWNGRKWSRL